MEEDNFGTISLGASKKVRQTLFALKEHFENRQDNKKFTHPLRYLIEKFR